MQFSYFFDIINLVIFMKVLAIIFDGFEELEATAPFALIRRAGINLTIASNKTTVTGGHNISYTNIDILDNINYKEYDALLLPGGPHYKTLQTNKLVHEIITYFMTNKKIVAAICAAPTIIGQLGLLKDRTYTCFTPMNDDFGGNFNNVSVVVDDNLITGRSAAASIDFAYAIIEKVAGTSVLNKVWERIFYEK